MTTFSASFDGEQLKDPNVMNAFQDLMNLTAENTNAQIDEVMKSFNVSEACASDVVYLRTRHRWSPALEDELIALHRAGTPVNMNEFGCTKESGEALMKSVENALKESKEN